MCFGSLGKLFGVSKPPHPSDWVRAGAMEYDSATGILIIDFWKGLNVSLDEPPNMWIPEIPDTGSMLPVFGKGNNNLLLSGKNPSDHQKLIDFAKEGDIAVYRTAKFYAIHRIKRIAFGVIKKYIFRGDNNGVDDPDAALPEEIQYVAVGMIP